jgi:hypothetical protein
MAGQLDFTNECQGGIGACVIGATFDRTLTWKNDDVPVNLTGATARMHVRQKLSSEDIAIDFNTTNGRIVLGGTAGTIQLKLTALETAELEAGHFVYDLLISHGTEVDDLIGGKFQIVPSVTHD